jgi:hypothetical protein
VLALALLLPVEHRQHPTREQRLHVGGHPAPRSPRPSFRGGSSSTPDRAARRHTDTRHHAILEPRQVEHEALLRTKSEAFGARRRYPMDFETRANRLRSGTRRAFERPCTGLAPARSTRSTR